MKIFETRVIKLAVIPEGDSLFSEMATYVEITDEGGGEFLTISQPGSSEGTREIRIESDEWSMLSDAITNMLDDTRRS